MGNYYGRKKNKIVANEIDNPNEGSPIVVTKNYMLIKNAIAPKIVDGFFDFSDAQQITLPSIGSYKHLYDHYVAFSTKSNFYAYMGSRNSRIYRDSSDTVHFSFSNEYIVEQKPGQFISYVYSTDSSAYPDNGVSGSYYYNQKEEINSLKINTPSIVMQSQSIPISWSSVSVSGYEVTYQLQRKIDSSDWETIYTGSDTSYTDTAGIWTQVQYQVALSLGEGIGGYTQSFTIPIASPQSLVISGQDGNLGTLTSNLPYTVSSNTGNPISLTHTVNGAQVVTLTVESGFTYNIPIADLPTGTGTIQIIASVKRGSETVTQTRTWTYYKTPINIPSTGGIAQLTQNGQNIWPVTVPDAVEAPVYLGGNLNAALNKLGQATLYNKKGGSITDVFGYDVPICQYETGSYVGTGTYGSINQSNSLTFSFEPKIVVIFRVKGDDRAPDYATGDPKNSPLFMINGVNGITEAGSTAYWGYNTSQWKGNIVKWYSEYASKQKNLSGSTYNYVAIG